MKQILLSKLQASAVFNVDRLTIYSWLRKGAPAVDPGGPGKPAKLDFQALLSWRKADLAQQWKMPRRWDSSEECIKSIAQMEAEARQRLRALRK